MYKKVKIFRTLTRLFILSLYCVLTFILYFQVDGPKCVQHSLHNAVMGCVHSRLRYRRARERLHFFLYLTYSSHKKISDFIQFHQTLCIYLHGVQGVQDSLLDLRCAASQEGNQALVELALIFSVSMIQGLQEHLSRLLHLICA